MNEDQRTWPMLKAHFVEAYKARLHSGLRTATQHGYHGAENATKDDDNRITRIANSIVHIQMANSAHTTLLNETIHTLSEDTRDLHESLVNIQQQ